MIAHILFVFICFLLDGILIALFPSNPMMQSLVFVPNLGFCALILTIRKLDSIDAYLFAIVFGMIFDYFFANTFLVYAFTYLFIAFVVQLWSKHMMYTVPESLILCISTLFVKDCVLYFFMSFQQITTMSLITWFLRREFLTILINAVLVFIVIFLTRCKDDYLEMRERRIRKEEKIEWLKLK